MAKLIALDDNMRLRLFVKKLKPGELYRFSKLVKSEILMKGEDEPRRVIFSFNGGEYIKFSKEKDCLVFKGDPLVDIGRLGSVTFFVPLDLKLKLTPIKRISKK